MTRFLTLHRLSKVGKARFMDERMERFFRSATAILAAKGWARLWFLEYEGAAVAAFICLEYAGSVGLYNSGFDPARAQLAPGIVLLAHVIQDAIERGIPTFDFLRGEEPYKYGFGPSPEDVFNIRVAGRRGRVAPVNLSVAILSVHTCPLAALGGKQTGGMNVYVRQTARELGLMGVRVDVFTRSQNATIPRIVELGPGARVIHLPAGPEAPMPREALHAHLDEFAAGAEAFAREQGLRYDLIHSHYWLSGVAGLRLRERWGAPLVHMFHTLGRLKNEVAETPGELEPALRIDEETRIVAQADRIVAANVVERAHLVWYYGARSERVAVIPCGVDTELFQPMDPAKARDLLELPPDPLLLYVGRLTPIKGLDTLLEAMVAIPEPAYLLVVGGEHDEPDGGTRRRAAGAGDGARPRAARALPARAAPAAAPPVLRRRRRHRDAVALRILRHGGARGHGLRQPGRGLARRRADHHGAGRGDRPPRPRGRSGRAGRRHHPLARQRGGPAARPAGHALGRRAPLAVRGGVGLPPLLRAASRRPRASPSRPLQELAMTTPGRSPHHGERPALRLAGPPPGRGVRGR